MRRRLKLKEHYIYSFYKIVKVRHFIILITSLKDGDDLITEPKDLATHMANHFD